MTDFDEKECLEYYPFEGDFGEPTDKTLKDKIAVARKENTCHLCAGKIQPGEKIRLMTTIFSGEIRSFRWCSECCLAMSKVFSGNHGCDPDQVYQRFALRISEANG